MAENKHPARAEYFTPLYLRYGVYSRVVFIRRNTIQYTLTDFYFHSYARPLSQYVTNPPEKHYNATVAYFAYFT